MKKMILVIALVLVFCGSARAGGWDFYFFGVNTKMLKQADYKMVILGAATSFAIHTAGHYGYAALNGMQVNQHGLEEIAIDGYSTKQYREFAQAGFVLQNLVGIALTTIPATRQTDFTKGYVVAAFTEVLTYPITYRGESGDFWWSNYHGGNRDWEYAGYLAIATHNVLRVKWYAE